MKGRSVLIFSLLAIAAVALAGIPRSYACVSAEDPYSVEVLLNKPGLSYDFSMLKNAENVADANPELIGVSGEVVVYKSHYHDDLAAILYESSIGTAEETNEHPVSYPPAEPISIISTKKQTKISGEEERIKDDQSQEQEKEGKEESVQKYLSVRLTPKVHEVTEYRYKTKAQISKTEFEPHHVGNDVVVVPRRYDDIVGTPAGYAYACQIRGPGGFGYDESIEEKKVEYETAIGKLTVSYLDFIKMSPGTSKKLIFNLWGNGNTTRVILDRDINLGLRALNGSELNQNLSRNLEVSIASLYRGANKVSPILEINASKGINEGIYELYVELWIEGLGSVGLLPFEILMEKPSQEDLEIPGWTIKQGGVSCVGDECFYSYSAEYKENDHWIEISFFPPERTRGGIEIDIETNKELNEGLKIEILNVISSMFYLGKPDFQKITDALQEMEKVELKVPEPIFNFKDEEAKEALRTELEWLSNTGIVEGLTDEDTQEIKNTAKIGYAGYNSRIFYEDGEWIPYSESKNPEMTRVKAVAVCSFSLKGIPIPTEDVVITEANTNTIGSSEKVMILSVFGIVIAILVAIGVAVIWVVRRW